MHEDTFTWRKDETIKMTVQFNDNPALWAGLELYGNILPWIFFPGLLLTTILPITGKAILQTLAWTCHCPVDRRLSILDIRMSRPRENILDFQEKKIAKN